MAYVGGDTIDVTYNHSVVGTGSFKCKAGEDATIDLGGFRSADEANMVTGDGQLIDQMTRTRGSIELPPVAWDMQTKNELEKLVKMAESPILGDWTITNISGAIFGGKGKPVGDLQGNANTAQITVKLAFEGKLRKIS